jgi:uncharacterized protein YjiS (DUF1127 family)
MTTIMHPARNGIIGRDRKAASPRRLWDMASAGITDMVTTLLDWQERSRQRRQLLALGDLALRDIGKSRADAAKEGERPFWRA